MPARFKRLHMRRGRFARLRRSTDALAWIAAQASRLAASATSDTFTSTAAFGRGTVTFGGVPTGGDWATGAVTFTGLPLDTETVTINGKVYTFQDTLTDVDGNVHIGADGDACATNLFEAITGGAGAGTDYATSTVTHTTVTATDGTGSADLTAIAIGTGGNAYTLSETLSNATVSGATMSGGVAVETITINGKVYSWQTTLTNVDGNLFIGASANACATTLVNAINLGTGSGSTYAAAMTAPAGISATDGTGQADLIADTIGEAANAFTLTEASTNVTVSGALFTGGISSATAATGTVTISGLPVDGVYATGTVTLSGLPLSAVFATGAVTFTGVPSDGEICTINGKVYTFQDTLTDLDGNVHIGADANACATNLFEAITLGSNAGTDYATSTTEHPQISATDGTGSTDLVSDTVGVVGNAYTLTEGLTNATVSGATLSGGVDTETVTVNGKVYTWQDTLTDVDGNVHIGADGDACATNLFEAITLGSGSGTDYAASTTLHATVDAADGTGQVDLTSKVIGTPGNAYTIAESSTNTTVSGATMSGGTLDTVTVGANTYTFQDTLTDVANNVHIGADGDACATNLFRAITAGTGSGTDYAASTVALATVTATDGTGVVNITAATAGTAGNSLALSETATNTTVSGANLAGALDAAAMTATGHGFEEGEGPYTVSTDGALPAPVAASTNYWISRVDANNFTLRKYGPGGLVVAITGEGSGTHTIVKVAGSEGIFEALRIVNWRTVLAATDIDDINPTSENA